MVLTKYEICALNPSLQTMSANDVISGLATVRINIFLRLAGQRMTDSRCNTECSKQRGCDRLWLLPF